MIFFSSFLISGECPNFVISSNYQAAVPDLPYFNQYFPHATGYPVFPGRLIATPIFHPAAGYTVNPKMLHYLMPAQPRIMDQNNGTTIQIGINPNFNNSIDQRVQTNNNGNLIEKNFQIICWMFNNIFTFQLL